MRALALVVLVAGCAGPSLASIADAGTERTDADPFADAEPYASIPAASDPAFWALAPNAGGVFGTAPSCGESPDQPLMPFSIGPLRTTDARPIERIAFRIIESESSGWTVGTTIVGDPMRTWDGYVSGPTPLLAFETRVVLAGGFLAVIPRTEVRATRGGELGVEDAPVRHVLPSGVWATATRVTDGRLFDLPATDVRALLHVFGTIVWVDVTADGPVLAWWAAGETGSVPLDGDPDVIRVAVSNGNTVMALGTRLVSLTDVSGAVPPFAVQETAELPAIPDELGFDPRGQLLARIGDALIAIDPFAEVDPELGSGVERLVPGVPPYILRDGVLHPLTLEFPTAPGPLRIAPSGAIVLDPRIGEPLAVLGDRRVVGRDGLFGPPRPPGPSAVSTEAALGGPIEAFVFDPMGYAWGVAAVATPRGHVVYELGYLWPGACGI